MSPHRRRHPRRDMLRDCHPPVLLPVVLRGSLDSLCFLKKNFIENTYVVLLLSTVLQNYQWWWRSFLGGASSSMYFFGYCTHYFLTKMESVGFANGFLYFGYTFIMAFLVFLFTGESITIILIVEQI